MRQIQQVVLQLECLLGLHDFLDDVFGHGLAPGEVIDGLDHLLVGFPLVPQMGGTAVIDVVLLGDPAQAIDARISAFQPFRQMRAWSHVLVPGPMKFDARLAEQLLKIESGPALFSAPRGRA